MDKELIFSYRRSTAHTEPGDTNHPKLTSIPSGVTVREAWDLIR
jgi:hypothetical protein